MNRVLGLCLWAAMEGFRKKEGLLVATVHGLLWIGGETGRLRVVAAWEGRVRGEVVVWEGLKGKIVV